MVLLRDECLIDFGIDLPSSEVQRNSSGNHGKYHEFQHTGDFLVTATSIFKLFEHGKICACCAREEDLWF